DLRREIAGRLEPDWPLLALDHYLELGEDRVALDAAGRTVGAIAGQPSLLVAARMDVETWLGRAAQVAELKPQVDAVKGPPRAALAVDGDADRKNAIEEGDEKALAQLASRGPRDQEVIVALASAERSAGHTPAATARLKALGAPGWTLGSVQQLL